MVTFLKNNIFNIIILVVLIYVLVELERVKDIAIKTEEGTELNNSKLDYVDADVNKGQLDTAKKCCEDK
jgi:uncharacterized protein (UPF0212 family)